MWARAHTLSVWTPLWMLRNAEGWMGLNATRRWPAIIEAGATPGSLAVLADTRRTACIVLWKKNSDAALVTLDYISYLGPLRISTQALMMKAIHASPPMLSQQTWMAACAVIVRHCQRLSLALLDHRGHLDFHC